MMIERHGDIFKVRNTIRNFRDKLADILYRAFFIIIEIKDLEMNQAGEQVYNIFVIVQQRL
jgi:hypothetical protein